MRTIIMLALALAGSLSYAASPYKETSDKIKMSTLIRETLNASSADRKRSIIDALAIDAAAGLSVLNVSAGVNGDSCEITIWSPAPNDSATGSSFTFKISELKKNNQTYVGDVVKFCEE